MLTQSLGVVGSDFVCNLASSDWNVITKQTLNSIENGLQIAFTRKMPTQNHYKCGVWIIPLVWGNKNPMMITCRRLTFFCDRELANYSTKKQKTKLIQLCW